jgi:acetyl-CoA carboxylase carboxyl transferase subunit beta
VTAGGQDPALPGDAGRVTIAAASALIHGPDGRVLLVLRGAAPNRGRWSLPGGKTEPGEGSADTVRREVAEETGLTVRPLAELEVLRLTSSGREYEIHVYEAVVLGGTLAPGDDAADARWFPTEQLAALPVTDGLVALIGRHRPVRGRGSPP